MLSRSWPTHCQKVFFGPNTVSTHLLECLPSAKSRAFIVTGQSLYTKTPLIKNIERILGPDRHAGTFPNIRAHAPDRDVEAGLTAVLADQTIDTIISVGGGSPIDSTKIIIFRAFSNAGSRKLHHISIPTTLSAAECSGRAGFTTESGIKTGLGADWLRPANVIYDCTFVHPYTPVWLVLSTGIRALDHAIEVFYNSAVPDGDEVEPTREKCLESITGLINYLPRYHAACQPDSKVTDSESIDSIMTSLQTAAYNSLGYLPESIPPPIGPSHVLGYALGSTFGISHGITSCLTLPPVIELKYKIDGEARARIDEIYKHVVSEHQSGSSSLWSLVSDLINTLGLTTDLTRLGVPKEKAGWIASRAAPIEKDSSTVISLREGQDEDMRGKPYSSLVQELVEKLY